MIYNSIEQVIGNTPLLKLDGKRYGLKNTDLYVKLEYLNPFGSIKDRTALGLLKDTKWKELERQNQHIIESSSGNTAKSLQVLASRHGVPVICVTNRIKVPEVENSFVTLVQRLCHCRVDRSVLILMTRTIRWLLLRVCNISSLITIIILHSTPTSPTL